MKGRLPMAALLVSSVLAALGGCAPTMRAPVIDRTLATAPAKHRGAARENNGDWRPDTYTVQKGDTLWGIALEYGLDYKDLAEWNGLGSSYVIKVGQQLRLKPAQDAVVTAPLKPAAVVEAAPVATDTFIKTQPKALKIPYSEGALAAAEPRPHPAPQPPAPIQANSASEAKGAADQTSGNGGAVAGEDQVVWAWPAQGKIITSFDDANGSKGIDIAGKAGQPVFASGSGKVVYSGSGLRGYGKLIIIKHNKTFLSAYAHNSQLLVKEGQNVAKGQKIAAMGDSDANRVELHFEIRRLGKPVDPLKYLPENGRP